MKSFFCFMHHWRIILLSDRRRALPQDTSRGSGREVKRHKRPSLPGRCARVRGESRGINCLITPSRGAKRKTLHTRIRARYCSYGKLHSSSLSRSTHGNLEMSRKRKLSQRERLAPAPRIRGQWRRCCRVIHVVRADRCHGGLRESKGAAVREKKT